MKKKQKREKRKSKHKSSKEKSKKRQRSKRYSSGSNSSSSSSPSPIFNRKRSKEQSTKPKDEENTVPLSCLLHKRNLLAKIAVNCLDADELEAMIPFCLIDRTKEELIKDVAEELELMSKKRILAVLEGKDASSSSESEESENGAKLRKGRHDSPEMNTPKTYDSNDRVSLTQEVASPHCPLEEGEIIDE